MQFDAPALQPIDDADQRSLIRVSAGHDALRPGDGTDHGADHCFLRRSVLDFLPPPKSGAIDG